MEKEKGEPPDVETWDDEKEFKQGIFKLRDLAIIVTIDNGKWHLSVSTPDRDPTYEEIKEVRYKFTPNNLYMAQIFPPVEEFVNIHPFTHHLWEVGRRNE